VVRNCSSVYASLHNSDLSDTAQDLTLETRGFSGATHLDFHPVSRKTRAAAPVSLVSRVDHGEYRYFPQSGKGLVAIAAASLEPSQDHIIRIMAHGIDGEGHRGLEFEGLWLNNGGSLISSQRKKETARPEMVSVAISMQPDKFAHEPHQSPKTEEVSKTESSGLSDNRSEYFLLFPRKTLEIVTDTPHTVRARPIHKSLAALERWSDLVGEMFGADHVSITVDGMCLTSPCLRGAAQSASVKDIFFRRYCLESLGFNSRR